MPDDPKTIEIGCIGNYYGGLHVRKVGSKREWAIENWDGFLWLEISESLYEALITHDATTTQ